VLYLKTCNCNLIRMGERCLLCDLCLNDLLRGSITRLVQRAWCHTNKVGTLDIQPWFGGRQTCVGVKAFSLLQPTQARPLGFLAMLTLELAMLLSIHLASL